MMEQTTPHISIIVPVYKVEKYLPACIDSILAQTFENFELILVDDGSPDNCGKICDEYAQNDNRIKVVHQKNAGASAARNKGIETATGKWITFVDADDTIKSDYLKDLIHYSKPKTLVIQGFDKILNHQCVEHIILENILITRSNFEKLFNQYKILQLGFPFSKLFENEILKKQNIRFNEHIILCEDLIFLLTYLLHINNVQMISGSNYNYLIGNTESISNQKRKFEDRFNMFKEYVRLNRMISSKYSFSETGTMLQAEGTTLMEVILSLFNNLHYNFFRRNTILKSIHKNYRVSLTYYKPTGYLQFCKTLFLLSPSIFNFLHTIKTKL